MAMQIIAFENDLSSQYFIQEPPSRAPPLSQLCNSSRHHRRLQQLPLLRLGHNHWRLVLREGGAVGKRQLPVEPRASGAIAGERETPGEGAGSAGGVASEKLAGRYAAAAMRAKQHGPAGVLTTHRLCRAKHAGVPT